MSDRELTTGYVLGLFLQGVASVPHRKPGDFEAGPERFYAWLNKVRAAAWDEGCMAGRNREHHKNMTDEQAAAVWANPYKEQP